MSKLFTAFSGAKRTTVDGRQVIDKLYSLKKPYSLSASTTPTFAGTDRPEFTDFTVENICVEKESTNLISDPTDFTTANWSVNGVTRATLGQYTEITEDSADSFHFIQQVLSNPTDNVYWVSVIAKKGEGNFLQIFSGGDGTTSTSRDNYTVFNLFDGTIALVEDESVNQPKIINMGNGEYYCSIRIVGTSAGGSINPRIGTHDGVTLARSYQGNGTRSVLVRGAKTAISNYLTLFNTGTRLAPSPVLPDFLLAPNSDTKYIAGVYNIVRDDSINQPIWEATDGNSFSKLNTSNQFTTKIASGTALTVANPITVNNNSRFIFAKISFYDSTTLTSYIFNASGAGFKYSGAYVEGTFGKNINAGSNGTGNQSSVYNSIIESETADATDANAEAIYTKLTKGDSRFSAFNSITVV